MSNIKSVIVLFLNILLLGGMKNYQTSSQITEAQKVMQPPKVKFYLFGMGNRHKFLYRDGTLFNALTGEAVHQWKVTKETIQPCEYTVRLNTSNGKEIVITEDEKAVWIQEGVNRLSLTEGTVNLPKFKGHPWHDPKKLYH